MGSCWGGNTVLGWAGGRAEGGVQGGRRGVRQGRWWACVSQGKLSENWSAPILLLGQPWGKTLHHLPPPLPQEQACWCKDTAARYVALPVLKMAKDHFIYTFYTFCFTFCKYFLIFITHFIFNAGSERAFSFISGELFHLTELFIQSSETTQNLE